MAQPALLWALQTPIHIISATCCLFLFLLPIPHWPPVQVGGWRPSSPPLHISQVSHSSSVWIHRYCIAMCLSPQCLHAKCNTAEQRASVLSGTQTALQSGRSVSYATCCAGAVRECTWGLLLSIRKIYKMSIC